MSGRWRAGSPLATCTPLHVLDLVLALVLLCCLTQLANCQPAASFNLELIGTNTQQQYRRSSPSFTTNHQSNSNSPKFNSLVTPSNSHNEQRSQSQPQLTQSLQVGDLDNVIESTTTSIISSLQQHYGSNINNGILTRQQNSNCQLSPTWTGKWYQSNKEPIRITNTEMSEKGLCRDQKGDKYLFEYNGINNNNNNKQYQNNQQTTSCLICLVINERHLNVLQYKESACQPIPPQYLNRTTDELVIDDDHSLLDTICSDITGDAQLESLFRLDTPAIECPINGQYSFTYDSCREPASSLDSCLDKKSLNFKFNACPDVHGSESKSEVLKCYADWTEGSNYYMIGRLEQTSNHLDKGKFRCFVYEKSPDGKMIQMAQSLEESCYGLINANEGPKTLRLIAKPPTPLKCHFPSYIQSLSENWLSVDNSLIYMFNQNSTKYQVKETKEGNVIEEAACLHQFMHAPSNPNLHSYQATKFQTNQQPQVTRRHPSYMSNYPQPDQSSQQVQSMPTGEPVYLVQITKNCHATNYCVRFHKRSNGIVQIDYFIHNPGDTQCRIAMDSKQHPQVQIITSTNLEYQRCPFEGAYSIEANPSSDLSYNPSNIFLCPASAYMTAQCDSPSRLRIHSKCSSTKIITKNLYCLGSWNAKDYVRVLLADDDRQRYSAYYRDIRLDQEPSMAPPSPPGQAQALAQTRSSQLLALGAPPVDSAAPNSLPQTLILHVSLITPAPTVTRPMSVKLTRKAQCSEFRGYTSHAYYGSGPVSSSSYSSLTSYSSGANGVPNAASSHLGAPSALLVLLYSIGLACYWLQSSLNSARRL